MNWKAVIDIKDIWQELKKYKEFPGKEILKPLIDKLKQSGFYNEDSDDEEIFNFTDLIDELEDANSWDFFNSVWNEIYDWADYNRVWIKTEF